MSWGNYAINENKGIAIYLSRTNEFDFEDRMKDIKTAFDYLESDELYDYEDYIFKLKNKPLTEISLNDLVPIIHYWNKTKMIRNYMFNISYYMFMLNDEDNWEFCSESEFEKDKFVILN